MLTLLQGLWPACLVPTLTDGTVDLPKILKHVNHLLRVGCDGVTLFGTCGEGASFTVTERKQVLEYIVRSGRPRRVACCQCCHETGRCHERSLQRVPSPEQ